MCSSFLTLTGTFSVIRRRIALKGAIRDFLHSPHCAANCLQHVRSSGPGAIVCKSRATHRALITCNMGGTWYEGTAQLLSLTELKSHLFQLYLYWLRPLSNDCLLVGCLTSQQHASVSQGRICSDNFTCCHTEIEVADQTFYLTQSQYTDTGPTSPTADPITPGAWQGSHWNANF